MHDCVPTQALNQPSSPVAQQLVSFLQAFLQALLQPQPAEQSTALTTGHRGQPARVSWEQLGLSLLLAVLRDLTCWRDVWQLIVWEGIGSFPPDQCHPYRSALALAEGRHHFSPAAPGAGQCRSARAWCCHLSPHVGSLCHPGGRLG